MIHLTEFMKLSLFKSTALLALIWVSQGCGSYSEVREVSVRFRPSGILSGPLGSIENTLMSASKSQNREPLAALGHYVEAARSASSLIRQQPHNAVAIRDYNFAVARMFETLRKASLNPWSSPMTVPTSLGPIRLSARPDKRPNWNPALYDFTPADQFDLKGSYVTERTIRPGVGAALVAVGKQENRFSQKDFGMQRIYYGVTAVAHFQGNTCEIAFEDPLKTESVGFEGRNTALAADFTAPLAVMLDEHDPKKLEIMRVLKPEAYAQTAKIVALQPYDPNKTVVLAIHGLMDSQATWTPMINTLRGDPEIRKHYQFWFYSYPSGYPYPYSASILRRELDAVKHRYPNQKPMVVIGHSMGGCISRLLITDSGESLWNTLFRQPRSEVKMSATNRRMYEDALVFRRRSEVSRVVMIAAPLKGSDLANRWIGRYASRLVAGPATLIQAGREAGQLISSRPGDLVVRDVPNSIDTLSPNNRFVKAINTIPMSKQVPVHTIIGDRGKGDTPNSSDGIVPYWSSHVDGAASELVVPSGHSAHQNPQAIREVMRILKLHLHARH